MYPWYAQGRWVLLDEVNLACSAVLDAVAPLLDPTAEVIHIAGMDEPINISSLRVFATMNPSSIGGNRRKLPRSITNYFTSVKLSEYGVSVFCICVGLSSALVYDAICSYTRNEMLLIVHEQFEELLTTHRDAKPNSSQYSIISRTTLTNCFHLHQQVRDEVSAGNIGAIGGPFELNLRDLEKLREYVIASF